MALYENPFHRDNVYGHVVNLLSDHTKAANGVHLDFGCNVGPIAEYVRDELGREYIGFDIDDEALEILRARGFSAHQVDLTDVQATESLVRDILGNRPIASMSIIDTLEHVPNGPDVLTMLRRLADAYSSPLISSVPNVAHRDVGFKLALGKWDYTPKGLLDYTHLHFFTQTGLRGMMRHAGWHEIAACDVVVEQSDQCFPRFHPAVASSSAFHQYLNHVRNGVDDTARINQFVRMWLPGPSAGDGYVIPEVAASQPFLSVVTRTQGRRLDTLRDVLLCLSAQSDQDFEVCIIGHKLSDAARLAVERVIEDTNGDMRSRVRLIKVDTGNRTHPLNVGFREARGEYVAILDDDDIVFGHWVEQFRKLAMSHPSRVLRATNVAQVWEPVRTSVGSQAVRAVGTTRLCYPNTFDQLDHLVENSTPPVSLAFPRAAFEDLGITFDESLSTTEDWDFLMRVAAVCGVASSREITSIYRQWENAESSFTVHTQDEWLENHHAIWRKLDAAPLLLEPGSATRIRQMVADYNLKHRGRKGPMPDAMLEVQRYEDALRENIHMLLHSHTWRLMMPLRILSALVGRRFSYPMLWAMNAPELEACQRSILGSRSFRIAGKIKRALGRTS